MGYARTALLLAGLTGFFLAIGYLIGGALGMILALGFAVATNVWAYWNSDKAVLRMHGAREVDERSAPQLYNMVEDLARNADLPMPKVYIMDQSQPNAFATGRDPDHAAVAATTGLLRTLTPEEIAGVMAHELAHIKNRDTLIMTITATIAGALSMLANFAMYLGGRRNMLASLAVMFLAPIGAMIVQMAISRTREYAADKLGGEICRNPIWLASALHKINGSVRGHISESAERNPATAHMFIMNPLNGQGMDNLFSTHPNAVNRIRELEKQGAALGVTGRESWA